MGQISNPMHATLGGLCDIADAARGSAFISTLGGTFAHAILTEDNCRN
ncbi:hypothetical protein V7139_08125 [Neobacillus drentensis]